MLYYECVCFVSLNGSREMWFISEECGLLLLVGYWKGGEFYNMKSRINAKIVTFKYEAK